MYKECQTIAADTRPKLLPPVECAPWCVDGDGHADAGHTDDQWCTSISFPVDLTLEGSALWSDGTTRPRQATVYANRDAGEPAMVTWVNQDDRGTQMTAQEAREAARTLLHAAWLVEQAG